MWYYKEVPVIVPPPDSLGFIYLITNLQTNKIYIGKKQLYFSKRSRIGVREKMKTGTRKIYKVVVKDSDWRDYSSSCKELQEEILRDPTNFKKEILEWCGFKRDLSYREVWWQFHYNVLEIDSYNGTILGKFFRKNI